VDLQKEQKYYDIMMKRELKEIKRSDQMENIEKQIRRNYKRKKMIIEKIEKDSERVKIFKNMKGEILDIAK
jgi:hypothetical protein